MMAAILSSSPALTGAGLMAAFLALLGIIWRTKPAIMKAQTERETTERETLNSRIQRLEDRLDTVNASRDTERAEHDAIQGLARHQINNLKQCLGSLLMLLKRVDDPQVQEAVALIEDMRARQEELEMQEKAAITTARMMAASARVVE